MEMAEITNILIAVAPALTSIVSMVVGVVVAYKRIRNEFTSSVNRDAIEKVKLENALNAVMKENAELKKTIRKKIDKIGE